MWVLACSQGRVERTDWGPLLFSWDHPALHPSLSQANVPAAPTSPCSSTLERRLLWLAGKRVQTQDTEVTQTSGFICTGTGSQSWCLHGQCTRGGPDLWRQPDWHNPCPVRSKSRLGPSCPAAWLHRRPVVVGAGCCGEQGDSDRAGAAVLMTPAQAAHQRPPASCGWPAVAPDWSQAWSLHGPLLLQHCSPLWQGCQCWQRGEHVFKGNRVNLDPILRASAPSAWDLTPPLIRQWQPWADRKSHLETGSSSSSFVSSPAPYHSDGHQHPEDRWLLLTASPALLPKVCTLYRDAPTWGHPFKTALFKF